MTRSLRVRHAELLPIGSKVKKLNGLMNNCNLRSSRVNWFVEIVNGLVRPLQRRPLLSIVCRERDDWLWTTGGSIRGFSEQFTLLEVLTE